MKQRLPELLAALGSGFLFAMGFGISGMTSPRKVLSFLDVTGDWDASLAGVMVGALCVHGLVLALSRNQGRPVLTTQFAPSLVKRIDAGLVGGAALFGVGWGLVGFCPGPVIVAWPPARLTPSCSPPRWSSGWCCSS